jgi:DNA-binding transcriptional ArsR family regulator
MLSTIRLCPNLRPVIRLHFGSEDLGRVRFALSPMWETITSVRALTATGGGRHMHRPWREWVRDRLDGVDLELLTALIRPAGYIPDFLVPSPARRSSSFRAALAQVTAAEPAAVSWQLRHLASHPVAAPGPGRAERARLLRRLAGRPGTGAGRVAEALDGYWRAAIAPHWPRLEALLHADIAYRLEELADGGVGSLLRNLHPSVGYDGSTLRIAKYYDGDADLSGRGLLLVPCAFAWPDVIVLTAEPSVPTVSYSPRGIGTLWASHASPDGSALAGVLGRTRAAVLGQLDLPMSTTQLATALALSAPTLSAHLHALHRAGILTSRRDGRAVLYSRTPLGDYLLASAADPA